MSNGCLLIKIPIFFNTFCVLGFVCWVWSWAIAASALALEELDSKVQPDCVILLHGMARTRYSMNRLARELEENNYLVVNDGYSSRKQTVASLAELVIPNAIQACLQKGRIEKIHFITHSLGGILVRYYFSRHPLQQLGRVVMLSPPNQGSEIVDALRGVPGFNALNGPAGLQLGTKENSVVKKLGPVNYEVGVITGNKSVNLILSSIIPGDDDGKVSLESAKVEGMSDYLVLPHSHSFIMRSEAVIKQSLYFLKHGCFERTSD